MDIVAKITMVASVIFMGFNASQFVASYATLCEKAHVVRNLARESDFEEIDLRRTNIVPSLLLSVAYVVLVFFSGLVPWIAAVIAFKLAFSLIFSDRELCMVIRGEEFKMTYFWLDKVDSFLNISIGLLVALFLVL